MGTRLVRRIVIFGLVAAVGVGIALGATTSHGGTVKAAHNGRYGSLLVTAGGMTLYHLTSGKAGTIACTGPCATAWPPLLLAAGTKPKAGSGASGSKLGTIRRPDGHVQVTYNGMALYRFALDRKAGDVKGQGVHGVWFAVTPAGMLAKAGAAPTTTTTGGYGR
jgi:predicted lipoprotein with Yx(FWY)xxD motif